MLQPVEGRFAGQSGDVRPLGLQRVGQQAQHRIVSQLVVIVDVLVAKRNGIPRCPPGAPIGSTPSSSARPSRKRRAPLAVNPRARPAPRSSVPPALDVTAPPSKAPTT